MSITLGGTSPAVTFPDATVQNTAVVSPSVIGQVPFSTDGSTFTPTAKVASGTAVASTSGTSIDFTSIPSWVKRITVMFANVSTNGSSNLQIQVGNGTIVTSGYTGGYVNIYANAGTQVGSNSSGFLIADGGATDIRSGQAVLTLISGNTWVCSLLMGTSPGTGTVLTGGTIALGGTLDRVRATTGNGTDTFDAGSINILYE